MFNENDIVVVKSSGAYATILEVADDIVYVELNSNGAEMEYNVDQLIMADEFEKAKREAEEARRQEIAAEAAARPSHLALGEYVPQKGDRARAASVIAKLEECSDQVPLFDAARKAIDDFDSLDAFDKVKHLSKYSGVPMVVWMAAGDIHSVMEKNDMIMAINRKALVNAALSGKTGLLGDVLLEKCRREIAAYEAAQKETDGV